MDHHSTSSRPSGLPRASRVPVPRKLIQNSDSWPPSDRVQNTPQASDVHVEAGENQNARSWNSDQAAGAESVRGQTSIRGQAVKARKPRTSLSDRTVETPTQIPRSSSPTRLTSGLFKVESIIDSPVRLNSTGHHGQPPSSHTHLPSLLKNHSASKSYSPSKQSKQRSNGPSMQRGTSSKPRTGIHDSGYKRKDSNASPAHATKSTFSLQTRSASEQPSCQERTKQSMSMTADDRTLDSPKSSAALRETIARAKAAHRLASKGQKPASSRYPQPRDAFASAEIGGSNSALIGKRIATARRQGKLNIAAMGLSQLPSDLLHMYDSTNNDDGSWAESVDLSKLCAADNEIIKLEDKFFPPGALENNDSQNQENGGNHVLEWLETLDLHGNQLTSLPKGLGQLSQLAILNLSRNRLDGTCLQIIRQLKALRELRLNENEVKDLSGACLSSLPYLELLDLGSNGLSTFPNSAANFFVLRALNLGGNKLQSLPGKVWECMHLRELNVARNRLQGNLIPSSCQILSSLKVLDVSFNALSSLVTEPSLNMPSLQSLTVSENRLQALPDLSTATSLINLVADGNQLTQTPIGLTSLHSMRNVDLSRNDLRSIDQHIGFMDNLSVFSIANNPMRERKFLRMNTEDLKRELRDRYNDNKEAEAGDSKHGTRTDSSTSAGPLVNGPGGVADLSLRQLEDVEVQTLELLANNATVKSLILKQNRLNAVPPAIAILGDSLVKLDLSNNKLNHDTYLHESINMPRLKTLDLSANAMTSLLPILSNISASSLTELSVSRNRLTELPRLRSSFPALVSFSAADNQISELPFASVQGLQVLDVSGNSIAFLEPKIGLLAQEGLRTFLIGANTFRVPRRDVVEKGSEAILTWLRSRIPDPD